ncbi:unnamed protein product [Laminaria digitata]
MAGPQIKIAKREHSQEAGRSENTVPDTEDTEEANTGSGFSLCPDRDVMTLLAELLSNQHAFFAGVSKEWKTAWGGLPKLTRAITADTAVSQLHWSVDSGLQKRPIICDHVAEHCGLEILQYTHSTGCGLPQSTCFKAAAQGQLEMIQSGLGETSHVRKVLCRAAAAGGSLPILKWARANGCPWDYATCSDAAGSGHLNILQWARSESCP